MLKWILVLLLAVAPLAAAVEALAQTAPPAADQQAADGLVQGPVQAPFGTGGYQSQGPAAAGFGASGFGASGLSGSFRPGSGSSSPAASAQTPIPPPTPTPVVDMTATNDVLHPPRPLATAQCEDGWFSYNRTREFVCAGHGGVMQWVIPPGEIDATVFERFQQAAAVAPYMGTYVPPPLPAVAAAATPTPSPAPGR